MRIASALVVEFVRLAWLVLPYFLVGALTGAVLNTLVPQRWTDRVFGRSRRASMPAAVALGALLPGCSCATMPMAAGLRATSRPRLGTVAAFIFVSPLLSPLTVALTWAMLGWRMTVGRVVASIAGSLLLGALLNRFESWFTEAAITQPVIAGGSADAVACCDDEDACSPDASAPRRLIAATWAILRQVTPHLALGLAIAAALTTLLPEDALPSLLGGSSGAGAFALAAIVGIPLYVCEGEEVPITLALLRGGLASGPAFTFLIGSVGTCVPTVLMSRKVIGDRAAAFYAAYWLVLAVAAGVVFQLII